MSTPGVPLSKLVGQTLERVVDLLRESDAEAADWVRSTREAARAVPSVVVVGETNRGKSSLVNALLAMRSVSPVDADVATATYLVIKQGEEWAGRACYAGQVPPVEFPIDELHHWVSVRAELPEGQLPPRYVEIEAPIPVLRFMSIVDTPGVGGLDSMHGELAAEAAANATALLFVVDASAPLTAGELRFLQDVGERVETVLFALTKTDQHRGWRQVLEANRQLLLEHAPRFADADFHPVSSRLFELAGTAPSEQAATMLREQSGIAALQSALQRVVVGSAAMLGEANALRTSVTALAEAQARFQAEQRALSTGEAEADALRARRDELNTERRSSTRGWQLKLRGDIQRTRVECGHEVSRQMRDVSSWFRRQTDAADREALANLPAQVDAALQMVSGRISVMLSQRLDRVATTALSELFSAEELAVIRAQFARAGQPPVVLRPPERRPPTSEDKLLVFMGVSGGLGLGRAVAMMPLAGVGVALSSAIVLPATIAIGLGAGWWMARTRKHAADKQHFKQWITEAIADGRSTMDQLVSEQLIEAEQQLTLALDDALLKRVTSIEEELREVDRALRLDAEERGRQLQVVNRRLADAGGALQRCEQLLGLIRQHHRQAEPTEAAPA
ncbi:dynamin family protein [Allokutzneria multivorans]|uniref:Dynamin family protein n=1 Tax=Allokutzneria multivorans TaxID=1142134 RepID=A0ABP7RI94_9PSEU